MIKKYFKYIKNCGWYYGLKSIFCIFLSKFIKNTKCKIYIKTKKTGKNKLIIRPFTTDLYLVNNLLLDNGEYDFICSPKYSWIKDAKVIVDAGACIGMFSRIISEMNKNALFISIEPEINNYNLLKENTKCIDNNICKLAGLWNKTCGLSVESSIGGEWGYFVRESSEKIDVNAIGINDILNEYNLEKIDILKCDIEGAEVEVFNESAKAWLDKVKMCIIEFHDRKIPGSSKKIIDMMLQNGFVYEIYEENYIFVNNKI